MMVLKTGGSSAAAAAAASNNNSSSRNTMGKPIPVRRWRSKGTIAGFARTFENGGDTNTNATAAAASDKEKETGSQQQPQQQQQQHSAVKEKLKKPPPCHSAWLALLATQNAVKYPKTQLALCPPGTSRRNLQVALEQQSILKQQQQQQQQQRTRQPSMRFDSEMTAYFGIDKMLGENIISSTRLESPSSEEEEEEEVASSGDEDELFSMEDIITPDTTSAALENDQKYACLQREPLFISPVGTDATTTTTTSSPQVSSSSSSPSSTTTSKLPFHWRKLKFFDIITAADSAKARAYLRQEVRKCKERERILLARHLRRMQTRERRRLQLERGETPNVEKNDDDDDEEEEEVDPQDAALLKSGVSQIKEPMTTSMAAALLLESLSLNPKESIEGMAKCYDGIVAAGVALLDSQLVQEETNRPRRSVIIAALEPLLITSLEQPSGEVILQLAKLRRMCGTPRYQRRFVQRVAPCLVRPPHAAMWCLQHQNDMEPILAAVEMIFDAAFDIFKKGWYERGQLLLADSVRKETLNSAAEQLKNLSSIVSEDAWALNSTAPHSMHHVRRGPNKLFKGAVGTTSNQGGRRRDGSGAPLAEWEVIAVDRQIRISISNILSNDWSRVAIVSRDVETALKNRRPGAGGVSAPTLARSRSGGGGGGEASPKSTPASPKRTTTPPGKAPLSPPSPKATTTSSRLDVPPTESIESVFGPSFASQPVTNQGDSPATPISPPAPKRKSFDEGDSSSSSPHKGQFLQTSTADGPSSVNLVSPARTDSENSNVSSEKAKTPPRSPGSPAMLEEAAAAAQASMKGQIASPSRGNHSPPEESSAAQGSTSSPSHPSFASLERVERAPLSPSGSVASEAVRAASSGASVASNTTASSQPSHYRMLTSTAAERKRTVAACRALRAQISRFEEAFMQLHGRAPKGAAERAPLATTYAQYREWKRAIRADAACRIQALFRGARCRWILLRKNDPRITRVIKTRAGRASFAVAAAEAIVDNNSGEAVIDELSIPREIEAAKDSSGRRMGSGRSAVPAQPAFDEAFSTSTASSPSAPLAPQWSTPGRRTGSGNVSTPPPYASPQGSPSPTGAGGGYQLSLAELQARKKELKQQLKQYDMNFARQHGRMPVKSEKEPIRHLYENYNALKSQIQMMEQEGAHLPPSVVQTQRTSPRSMSPPTLTVISGPESSDESPTSAAIVRSRRKPKRPSPPLSEGSSASTPTAAPPQDLAALKAEKQQLHQMLRSYEKDFFREHKRQVSSFADIKPVASQYRRYKEIKKAIATLQQQQQQSGER